MITTNDVHALIAFAIQNNKLGLIQSLNSLGYTVSQNITDEALFTSVRNIYTVKGLNALKAVLDRVALDKRKLTQEEARNLSITYLGANPDPNAKFGDWLKGLGQGIGDFLSGQSSSTVAPTIVQQTTTSPVSSTTIIILAAVAIVAIVILAIVFRKSS